jgi:hypothetical protein
MEATATPSDRADQGEDPHHPFGVARSLRSQRHHDVQDRSAAAGIAEKEHRRSGPMDYLFASGQLDGACDGHGALSLHLRLCRRPRQCDDIDKRLALPYY